MATIDFISGGIIEFISGGEIEYVEGATVKDPRLPFQSAAITAIEAALVSFNGSWSGDRVLVDPRHDESFPYVHIDGSTVIPWHTKDTRGAEFTMTFTSWADSYVDAAQCSDQVLQTLTDNTTPLVISGYSVARDDPDILLEPLKDDIDPDDIRWGFPVRVRYIVKET